MVPVAAPSIHTFDPTELKQRRNALGLTQATVAKRVGVSLWTLRQWEYGNHTPRTEPLWQLSVALECDIGDLLKDPVTLADYRAQFGLTQAHLAQQLGVSRSTVSWWEMGKLQVGDKHVGPLAFALGLDLDVLKEILPELL